MTAKKVSKSDKPAKGIDAKVSNGEIVKSKVPIGKVREETFSLHVRGPKWIKDRDNSEARLKELNARITHVRHPRQKSADYVFVDFANAEDRDEAYKELLPLKDVFVQLARKDNAELVEFRKAKVQAKREAKKQLAALMKNIAKNEQREKKSKKPKKVSNQIVILNLPKETTQIELNEHFDNVIDYKLNLDKNPKRKFSKAILTLATPKEALNASKKEIKLHGVQLKIHVHKNVDEVAKMKRVEKAKKRKLTEGDKKSTEDASDEPQAKRPLVLAPKKLKQGKKKIKAKAEKTPNVVEKAVAPTKKKENPGKKVASPGKPTTSPAKKAAIPTTMPSAKTKKPKKAKPVKKVVKTEEE